MEMNRTDVAHLFRWVYPSQTIHQKLKNGFPVGVSRFIQKSGVDVLEKIGLKWVAVARFGLKMRGNESHKVQDHF